MDTMKRVGLALMGAKQVNDEAFIRRATLELEAELVKFVGKGSIFGESLEMPKVVMDMCDVVCSGGESVCLKTAVTGVYKEGYRKIREHNSVHGKLVGIAHDILTGFCATSSEKALEEEKIGGDKSPEEEKAEIEEEDCMIEAIRFGDEAVDSLLNLLKKRASMKGGCERLRCKLLGLALRLIEGGTNPNIMVLVNSR